MAFGDRMKTKRDTDATQVVGQVWRNKKAVANSVKSYSEGISGGIAVRNIIGLTQAEYDAIAEPKASTLYLITDA